MNEMIYAWRLVTLHGVAKARRHKKNGSFPTVAKSRRCWIARGTEVVVWDRTMKNEL